MEQMDDTLVFTIDGVHVADDLLNVWFQCNLAACHGVCCATPEASAGAPLTEGEQQDLQRLQTRLEALLPAPQAAVLAHTGLAERLDTRYFTRSLPGTSQCVLATHAAGCYSCVVQQHRVDLGTEKPISCSLFPIRELLTDEGAPLLVLEYWDECAPGFDHGYEQQQLVYQALKPALVQRFGLAFWEKLDEFVQSGEYDRMVDAQA